MGCISANVEKRSKVRLSVQKEDRIRASVSIICPIDTRNFKLADGRWYVTVDHKYFNVKM